MSHLVLRGTMTTQLPTVSANGAHDDTLRRMSWFFVGSTILIVQYVVNTSIDSWTLCMEYVWTMYYSYHSSSL